MTILKYKPTRLDITAKIASDPLLQAALMSAVNLAADADRDEANAKRAAESFSKDSARYHARRAKQSRQNATDAATAFFALLRSQVKSQG